MGFGGGVLLTRRKHSHHLRAASGAAGTQQIRGGPMKEKYDFSRGKRGRIVAAEPEPRGKTRITIRLDEDLGDHFLKEANASGGEGGDQALIKEALRRGVEGKAAKLEGTLPRGVRGG